MSKAHYRILEDRVICFWLSGETWFAADTLDAGRHWGQARPLTLGELEQLVSIPQHAMAS
jgi:hypothetical protein